MEVIQYRFGEGNLSYVLYSSGRGDEALVIDGGAVKDIEDFLAWKALRLKYVLNTHDHADHTPGNQALLKLPDAEFISCGDLVKMGDMELNGEKIAVQAVPGHTKDSILFHFDNALITGDTLFNGTVGNCYTGDYETYFSSLKKVLSYPNETVIYAGHDLVEYAMGVAKKLEPENRAVDAFLEKYNPSFVYSTLEEELNHNPFIRFNDPRLDSVREGLGMPLETEYQRWRALMTIH